MVELSSDSANVRMTMRTRLLSVELSVELLQVALQVFVRLVHFQVVRRDDHVPPVDRAAATAGATIAAAAAAVARIDKPYAVVLLVQCAYDIGSVRYRERSTNYHTYRGVHIRTY